MKNRKINFAFRKKKVKRHRCHRTGKEKERKKILEMRIKKMLSTVRKKIDMTTPHSESGENKYNMYYYYCVSRLLYLKE